MPKFLLKTPKVLIGGVDLSIFAHQLDTPDSRAQVDVSGFNPNGTAEFLPGQRTQSIVVSFMQGFGSNEPHRVLDPLYESGTTFPIQIVPDTNQPISPSNPSLGGTASLYDYDGLNGALNARAEITATFLPATGTGFAWGTA
jgi:hypothetical protein